MMGIPADMYNGAPLQQFMGYGRPRPANMGVQGMVRHGVHVARMGLSMWSLSSEVLVGDAVLNAPSGMQLPFVEFIFLTWQVGELIMTAGRALVAKAAAVKLRSLGASYWRSLGRVSGLI